MPINKTEHEEVLYALYKYKELSKSMSTGTIARFTNINRFKVLGIFKVLIRMKYLAKMPTGFKKRWYQYTKHFPPDYITLLDNYETFKVVKREFININIKKKGGNNGAE